MATTTATHAADATNAERYALLSQPQLEVIKSNVDRLALALIRARDELYEDPFFVEAFLGNGASSNYDKQFNKHSKIVLQLPGLRKDWKALEAEKERRVRKVCG